MPRPAVFLGVCLLLPIAGQAETLNIHTDAQNTQHAHQIVTEQELQDLPPDVAARVMDLLLHGDRYEKAIRQILIASHNARAYGGACSDDHEDQSPEPSV